jgi:WXG100 family type VII secretion target
MADETGYDPEAMKAAGREFVKAFDDVAATMNSLKGELDNFRKGWTGQASRKFDEAMESWGREFDSVLGRLDTMADKLLGGSGNAEDAEDFAMQSGNFFQPTGGK